MYPYIDNKAGAEDNPRHGHQPDRYTRHIPTSQQLALQDARKSPIDLAAGLSHVKADLARYDDRYEEVHIMIAVDHYRDANGDTHIYARKKVHLVEQPLSNIRPSDWEEDSTGITRQYHKEQRASRRYGYKQQRKSLPSRRSLMKHALMQAARSVEKKMESFGPDRDSGHRSSASSVSTRSYRDVFREIRSETARFVQIQYCEQDLPPLSPYPPQEPAAAAAKRSGRQSSNCKQVDEPTLRILEGDARAIATASPDSLSRSLASRSQDQARRRSIGRRAGTGPSLLIQGSYRGPEHSLPVSCKSVLHHDVESQHLTSVEEDTASSCDSMVVHQDPGSPQQLPPRLDLVAVPAYGDRLTSWREAGVDLGRMPGDGYRRGIRDGVPLR
ncbi:hypothetical protein BDV96DRAFT_646386 [Lophiotrema nucula]|uniref:Uncharacterized protein n=1 Tax=Lophiotrema nucula TaxID=690887 RepID=A0A6A5Z8V5_9PLEO|nr:hypothetical protein BDV96DRAFT_646386 [Lophiotrema nucula]